MSPEQADNVAFASARAYAAGRLAVPAMALIIISVLGILMQAYEFAMLSHKGVDAVIPLELRQKIPQHGVF